jgi:adenylate cyclase
MPAILKALTGGEVYPLGDFNLIGRSEEASIRLGDAGISRQHATIRREGAHYWLVDLGSANGSYVNDVAMTNACALRTGDRLQFGSAIFLFDQGGKPLTQDMTAVGLKTQVLKRTPVPMRTQPATLFVGDLKGFTAMSSLLGAAEVADLLREWYADCNAIMKRCGAMVDKFIGDCVFAYWTSVEHDALARALEAARALRRAELDAESPTRRLLKEQKNITLDCRIGLHVGEVAIGAMGRGINTALGDAVNLAFRLEGLTRVVDKPILVSGAFLAGWQGDRSEFTPCGHFEVKGHPAKIEVYSVTE